MSYRIFSVDDGRPNGAATGWVCPKAAGSADGYPYHTMIRRWLPVLSVQQTQPEFPVRTWYSVYPNCLVQNNAQWTLPQGPRWLHNNLACDDDPSGWTNQQAQRACCRWLLVSQDSWDRWTFAFFRRLMSTNKYQSRLDCINQKVGTNQAIKAIVGISTTIHSTRLYSKDTLYSQHSYSSSTGTPVCTIPFTSWLKVTEWQESFLSIQRVGTDSVCFEKFHGKPNAYANATHLQQLIPFFIYINFQSLWVLTWKKTADVVFCIARHSCYAVRLFCESNRAFKIFSKANSQTGISRVNGWA